jgi:hypothetical protein
MHKKSQFNDRMDEIQATHRLLEELKEKKTQVLESINDKALHKTKQLSLIKKVISILLKYMFIFILNLLLHTIYNKQ